ncbi:hypothetical protein LCGC14_2792600, partial [marine sediment metagenome]
MNTKRLMLGVVVLVVILGIATPLKADRIYHILDQGLLIQDGWTLTGSITVRDDKTGFIYNTDISAWEWQATNAGDTVTASSLSGGKGQWLSHGILATSTQLILPACEDDKSYGILMEGGPPDWGVLIWDHNDQDPEPGDTYYLSDYYMSS